MKTNQQAVMLKLTEDGDGWPRDGEVVGDWIDGEMRFFRVVQAVGPIHTRQGAANWCYVLAEELPADEADKCAPYGLRRVRVAIEGNGQAIQGSRCQRPGKGGSVRGVRLVGGRVVWHWHDGDGAEPTGEGT